MAFNLLPVDAGILTTKTQRHEENSTLCLRVFVVHFLGGGDRFRVFV